MPLPDIHISAHTYDNLIGCVVNSPDCVYHGLWCNHGGNRQYVQILAGVVLKPSLCLIVEDDVLFNPAVKEPFDGL